MMLMTEIDIGDTMIETTRLGFGCAGLMREVSSRRRQALLHEAFERGIRHYDVARMYGLGKAESELGKFLRGKRDDVTVATKFGIDPSGKVKRLARFQAPARYVMGHVPAVRQFIRSKKGGLATPRNYNVADAARSLDESLQELSVDCIDFLFVHDPRPDDELILDELRAFFEQSCRDGKIRAWGVSQDSFDGFNLAESFGSPAVLQLRVDVRSPVTIPPPRFSFGVLGNAYRDLILSLNRSESLRAVWQEALTVDPFERDWIPRLLLADALDRNPAGTVLYSTGNFERIGAAASVIDDDDLKDMLPEFRRLVQSVQS